MERQTFTDLIANLPEVEPGGHMGALDFRLRKKIFATLTQEDVAGFKLTPETQAILMSKAAYTYNANGGRGERGWTKAPLADLTQEDAELALREAWRGCASKRQLAALDAAS